MKIIQLTCALIILMYIAVTYIYALSIELKDINKGPKHNQPTRYTKVIVSLCSVSYVIYLIFNKIIEL